MFHKKGRHRKCFKFVEQVFKNYWDQSVKLKKPIEIRPTLKQNMRSCMMRDASVIEDKFLFLTIIKQND